MNMETLRQPKKNMEQQHFIDNLLEDDELRFVFVGGKGGVGKTTTSSALACQMAFNRKVLLISTDPAHSLSDAFRMNFTGEPTPIPGVPNLEVMEVNPVQFLHAEIGDWAALAEEAGMDDMVGKIGELQEWLSGIPGVDEATALSSVIDLVESGKYDTIVFDTAPTGHTLKLLQLPAVMEAGLTKLESWQSSMWNYWQMIKGASSNPIRVKREVSKRIRSYKHGVEKVGMMLKDARRTKFVVVCIAEYLSVSETQRLLSELKRHGVAASNVVVNQLLLDNLTGGEASELEALVAQAVSTGGVSPALQTRVRATVALANSRHAIQQKYLNDLRKFPEAQGLRIVAVPLLPSEVTGPQQLLNFSKLLTPPDYRAEGAPSPLPSKSQKANKAFYDEGFYEALQFCEGDKVTISGLAKSPHYNDLQGEVVRITNDGRVAVRVADPTTGKFKVLSLRPDNLAAVTLEEFL